MILLVLGFLSILVITFGLILAVTRGSPEEKSIEQRMASIHEAARTGNDLTPEAAQLLKINQEPANLAGSKKFWSASNSRGNCRYASCRRIARQPWVP